MEPSKVSGLLYNRLNFRDEKQKVIAGNLANMNTPKYKTKDIKFVDKLQESYVQVLELKVTHKAHIQIEHTEYKPKNFRIYEPKNLPEQNDGNNVNMDKQVSLLSQNSVMFEAIQKSIKKDSSWMKEMLASSAKN